MKNMENWIKKIKNMEDRSQAIYLLLIITFIFSQNITWRILLLIPDIENAVTIKSSSLYQTCAGATYVFAAIFLTSDGAVLSRFLQNHPAIMHFVDKIIYISAIVIGALLFSILVFTGLLCLPLENFKSEFYSTKKAVASYVKACVSTPFLNIKIIQGVSFLIVLLIIFSYPLPASIISVVADIFSMVVGIVSFTLVICNVQTKMISDRLMELNKEKERN